MAEDKDEIEIGKKKPKEVVEEGGIAIYDGKHKKYVIYPRVDKRGRLLAKAQIGYYDKEGKFIPITPEYGLPVQIANPSDIEMGAIELKDADTDVRAKVESDNTLRVSVFDTSGNRVDLAKEVTLSGIKAQTDKLQFDENGNLLTFIQNSPIAYDSVNDLFKLSIERDSVGLAKDSTLQTALPRNITEISGTALTGRDWSLDFAKLQDIEKYLSDLDPAQADYITDLKFSGSFTAGTYSNSYTPANGEIVYIHTIVLSSYTGKGELTLDFGGDILGNISVESNKDEKNTRQDIMLKIEGDGSTPLTLTLDINADGEYFGAVRMWKVMR